MTDDAVVFLRETGDSCVLVALSRADWAGALIPHYLANETAHWAESSSNQGEGTAASLLNPQTLYGQSELASAEDNFVIPGGGPSVHVWQLR